MEEIFKDPIPFKNGTSLRDLMSSGTEFQIDLNFRKQPQTFFNADEDLYPDMDDEDDSDEDILKTVEESTSQLLLASPEYLSFDALAETMIDLDHTPLGSVKIQIIEEGDGLLMGDDSEVTFHYAAYYEKGSIPFDSTLTQRGNPVVSRLGEQKLIIGLQVGLRAVRGPSARFHLLLQPVAAWGKFGVPPKIRPLPVLMVVVVYSVRDVRVLDKFNSLPEESQSKFEVAVKAVKTLKANAKDSFTNKKYRRAINCYRQCISILTIAQPKTKDEEDEIKKIKVQIYMNLAVCHYRMENPEYVIKVCELIDQLVDIETHCKALFYCGRAVQMQGKMDEAVLYFKKALKLEQKNKLIGATLATIDVRNKKYMEQEIDMWQKALRSEPKEKKVVYDVDEDFQNGVRDMCQDLAGREEFAKFDLPTGLTADEVICIKSLASKFEGLIVTENGEGKKKRVTIIKK